MKSHNFKLLSKKYTRGTTLIEVMVSVFILTFGILALMAAQLRSVASVSEAENKSMAAQAAEALAEGMQANPSELDINSGDNTVKRRYSQYISANWSPVNDSSTISSTITGNKTKAALTKEQLDDFKRSLTQSLPNASNISYAICRDNSTPGEPSISSPNCSNSNSFNSVTVIKILWCMQGANGTSSANTACGNANESTAYTYMLKVAD